MLCYTNISYCHFSAEKEKIEVEKGLPKGAYYLMIITKRSQLILN
jgi:hypothetical protein